MATKTKTKVNKMLSPEELTLIENLEAMIADLKTMNTAAAAGDDGVAGALKAVESMAGTVPNEEIGGTETPDIEAAQRKKELMGQQMVATKDVSTDTDVPPANAPAEERIEELPKQDEENIGEVAKALKLLVERRGVGKSVDPTGADPIVLVAKAMQAMGDRMSVYETSMTQLLKGMGIVDQVVAQEKVEKEARVPVGNTDQAQVIDMVAKALLTAVNNAQGTQAATPDDKKSMAEVRKDMTGVLGTLGQSALWNHSPGQPILPVR